MFRPLRLEFDGVLYHVTSRGDRRESIVEDGWWSDRPVGELVGAFPLRTVPIKAT